MSPGEIRTRNPSKRVAADRRLRPRGQWDRLLIFLTNLINNIVFTYSHKYLTEFAVFVCLCV